MTGFIRGVSHPGNQHAGKDGMETVEKWKCAAHCLIRVLDAQSGVSTSSGGGGAKVSGQTCYGTFKGHKYEGEVGFKDVGGASRYFKQIGGFDGDDFDEKNADTKE